MPRPGKRWRHLIINTRCSWLHGSERGFRNRAHRIHSSGDYKNPPPPREHEGLRKYHRRRSREPVTIAIEHRAAVGPAFLKRMRKCGHQVLALAVADRHVHALVEILNNRAAIRKIVGWCKCSASLAMGPDAPKDMWAQGGEFKLINDKSHQENTYLYILLDQGTDAWTWSYRDELGIPRFLGLEDKLRKRAARKSDRSGASRSGPSQSSGLGVEADPRPVPPSRRGRSFATPRIRLRKDA